MMASENKRRKYIEALQANRILKDLDADQLPRIKTRFHFVVSGRLKIYKMDEDSGREFTLFLLKKNDAFDVLCLLGGCEHKVFYETLDKVVLLSTPMEKMKQWVKTNSKIKGWEYKKQLYKVKIADGNKTRKLRIHKNGDKYSLAGF